MTEEDDYEQELLEEKTRKSPFFKKLWDLETQ